MSGIESKGSFNLYFSKHNYRARTLYHHFRCKIMAYCLLERKLTIHTNQSSLIHITMSISYHLSLEN